MGLGGSDALDQAFGIKIRLISYLFFGLGNNARLKRTGGRGVSRCVCEGYEEMARHAIKDFACCV